MICSEADLVASATLSDARGFTLLSFSLGKFRCGNAITHAQANLNFGALETMM